MAEKVLIRYEGNGSSRYDGKQYFEPASKLRRENSRGPLKNGEEVTMKAKNRVWRAVVVDVKPEAPPKPKKRKTAAAVMATSDVVLASFPPHEGDPVTQPSTTTPSTHTPVSQPSTTIPSAHTPVSQPSTTIPSTHTPVSQPSTTIPSTHTPVSQPSTTIPSTHTPVSQPSTTIPSTHTPVSQPSTTIPSTHTPVAQPSSTIPSTHTPVSQPSTTIPSTHTPVSQPSTTIPSTHTPVSQPSTTIPSTHTPVAQPSTTTPSTHTPDIQLSYDTPLSPVSILRDFDLYNNFYTYDEPAPSEQLDRIEAFLRAFQSEVFSRLDRLEASVQSQRQVSTPRVPHPTNSLPLRPPLADVNSQQVSAATDAKIQALLVNPRITGPVHLASELAKLIFTEKEMAACTLTGRKINGQCRQMLDSGKMCLIEHLVQQKFSMGEAEFASVRSGIRDSLANRCKYLRLMLAPRNIDII